MGTYIYAITKKSIIAVKDGSTLRVNQYEYLLKPYRWEAYRVAWHFGEKIPTYFDDYEKGLVKSWRPMLVGAERRYQKLLGAGQISNLFVEGALPKEGQVVRVYNMGQGTIGSTYEDDSVPNQAMDFGYLYRDQSGSYKIYTIAELDTWAKNIWGAVSFKAIAEGNNLIPVVTDQYMADDLNRQEKILANLYDGMGGTIRNDNNKAIRS